MKKVLYIFLLLLSGACANNNKPESSMEVLDMKNSTTREALLGNDNETFVYESLAKQILQDYYDLLLLQKKHPEFKEDIKMQLQHISKDSIYFNDSIENISIENLQQLG